MAADIATTLQLLFKEEKPIAALDLSSFSFDLNRLYVLALRVPDGEYGVSIRPIPRRCVFRTRGQA
jgi:hypothetical protein